MKKTIAMTLVLLMCLSFVSVAAFAAEDGMIVEVAVPDTWEECYVYTWEPELFGPWPGTKVTDSAFVLTSDVDGMVLSAGLHMPQTTDIRDLAYTAGGEAAILIGEAGTDGKHAYTIQDKTQYAPPEADAPENTNTDEKRTLTVEVPDSWTTVYVYTWDDNDYSSRPFGEYPGSAIPQKSDNTYECEIDVSIHNLVFSNQNGHKTNDLNIYSDSDIKIVIASDGMTKIIYPGAIFKPPAIEPEGELSEYRVVGSADWLGKWDPAFEGGRMFEISDGIYRKNFENVEPGSYALKITKDGKWDNAYGINGQNYTFTVQRKCTITVDFKLNGDDGVIEVYGQGGWWDEDEEENPKSDDRSLTWLVVLLLSGTAALPLLLRKKKEIL